MWTGLHEIRYIISCELSRPSDSRAVGCVRVWYERVEWLKMFVGGEGYRLLVLTPLQGGSEMPSV